MLEFDPVSFELLDLSGADLHRWHLHFARALPAATAGGHYENDRRERR